MPGRFLVAVSALIERDGAVLLLRRGVHRDQGPGEWEPVSGRLEAGETPENALSREVREETGLQVEIGRPFDTYHIYRGAAQEELIGITYHCRYVSGDVELSPEHDAWRWVPFSELPQCEVADGILRCFNIFLDLMAP